MDCKRRLNGIFQKNKMKNKGINLNIKDNQTINNFTEIEDKKSVLSYLTPEASQYNGKDIPLAQAFINIPALIWDKYFLN